MARVRHSLSESLAALASSMIVCTRPSMSEVARREIAIRLQIVNSLHIQASEFFKLHAQTIRVLHQFFVLPITIALPREVTSHGRTDLLIKIGQLLPTEDPKKYRNA